MQRVLVTGGFGFLGGHLIELLVKDGDVLVHVVDNLSSSPVPLDYLLDSIGRPVNLTFDICSVAEYFSQQVPAYDAIYHLASPVGPAGVLAHGGDIVRVVINDTYLVLDHCLAHGARLLDVSTSEVYGGGQNGMCSEAAPKIVPPTTTIRLEYAVAKLAAETAIMTSVMVKGLHASIVRPFNVAGPRQSPVGGFVLPRFIRQAAAGEPLTVFGDGSALRAFTHVRDVVDGLWLAMTRGRDGVAYNIGNPRNKISILELARATIAAVGASGQISYVDPRDLYGPLYAEANDKFPDASSAVADLGWTPQYGIADTIADAYRDYLQQRSAGIQQPTLV